MKMRQCMKVLSMRSGYHFKSSDVGCCEDETVYESAEHAQWLPLRE